MRPFIALVIVIIPFLITFLALLFSSLGSVSNANSVADLEACLEDGSCLGGSAHFDALVVSGSITANNLPLSGVFLLNNQTSGPAVTLTSEMGSNILISNDSTGIRLSQAIVVDRLTSEHTEFGTNTTCVMPLQSECYNISGQTCENAALLLSCVPQTIEFDTLHIQGTMFLSNSSLIASFPEHTDVNVSHTTVNAELITTHNMSCTNGATIDHNCLHLGGIECTTPMDPSCIEDSIPFYDVTVNATLYVNGSTVCLGPPLDGSCAAISSTTDGDTTGLWSAQQVIGLQTNPLDVTGLSIDPTALVWNDTAWIVKPVNALDALPESIMARDANGNSSATTVFSEASLIQNGGGGGDCVGLGRPKLATQRFYFGASPSTPTVNSYNLSPTHLVYYDSVTNKNTFVPWSGSFTGGATIGLFFHPNGTLYLSTNSGAIHRFVDIDTAFTELVCTGLSRGAYAYDANSTLYVLFLNGDFMTMDLPTCQLSLVKTLSITPVPNVFQGVIVDTTFYIHLNFDLWTFDIGASTSNVPTLTPMPASLGHTLSSAGEVYSECIGGVRVPATFSNTAAVGFNTSAFDPITYTPITSQFKFTNVNNPGLVFSAGKSTAEATYWYSWSGVANDCFEPTTETNDPGITCIPYGDMDMEGYSIHNVHGLATTDIYPATMGATEITISDFGLQMGRYSIQFLDNTTRVSRSGAGAPLSINEGTGQFVVNNQVEAKQYYSSLGGVALSADIGAGTTAPSVLTVTGARTCRWIVSVTTSAAPAASSIIFDVILSDQTDFAPGIVFSPVTQSAAQLAGNQMPYVTNEGVGGFSFMSNVVALAASTNYQWTFQNCI